MDIKFTDFYGQHVRVHDETASGNIRMEVRTMPSMSDVRKTPEKDCTVVTDISLDTQTTKLLLTVLETMYEAQQGE